MVECGWPGIQFTVHTRCLTRESDDGDTDKAQATHLIPPRVLFLPSSPYHNRALSPSLDYFNPSNKKTRALTSVLFAYFGQQCLILPNKIKTRAFSSQSKHLVICAMAPSSSPRPYTLRASAVRTFLTISRPQCHTSLSSFPATQPTPALSVASSSNSPTLTSPTLASEDHMMDSEEADFVGRLSNFPVVSTAIRAYEQSKASSRVVKVRLYPICSLRTSLKKCGFTRDLLVWRRDDGVFHEEHIAARH